MLYSQINKNDLAVGGGGGGAPLVGGGGGNGGPTRSTSIDTVSVELTRLPEDALAVVEKLGEGQFGEIHLCRHAGSLFKFGGILFTTFRGHP